jgi:hypothetical protein
MWNISTDQAAEMYARVIQTRHGSKALEIAASKTAELRRAGDTEGERVWAKVQRAIEQRTQH